MSRFTRGQVVARGHRFGMVWADDAAGLVVLPIMQPRQQLVNDVLLELSDLIACGTPIAHAVIRPKPTSIPRDRQEVVGAVPGPTMCRVVQAVIRATLAEQAERKWQADREHRLLNATGHGVNLVRTR